MCLFKMFRDVVFWKTRSEGCPPASVKKDECHGDTGAFMDSHSLFTKDTFVYSLISLVSTVLDSWLSSWEL